MFGKWFPKDAKPAQAGVAAGTVGGKTVSPLSDADLALMTDFLCRSDALLPLTPPDIAVIARFMTLQHYAPGTALFSEGEETGVDHMLWILDGEVTIEGILSTREEPVTLTVLEPGRMLGEMGFLDGSPRSVTCTAYTAMRCAMLTKAALRQLAQQHPDVTARLLCGICIGISGRLRAFNLKFMRHVIVNHLMRQEIGNDHVDDSFKTPINHDPS